MRTLDARAGSPHTALADVHELWERLGAARAELAAGDEGVIREQMALSAIPSPTGGEAARGAYLAARFDALGLRVRVDEVGNVLGTRVGADDDAPVFLCAHLDTVFPGDADCAMATSGRAILAMP